MKFRPVLPPLTSCFWLVIPILIGNIVFARQLPAAFQPEVFALNIPLAITLPENLLRIIMFTLIAYMPFRQSGRLPQWGLVLFLIGVTLYVGAWLALILAPQSAWSTSIIGFLAPAYTPALWLAGIGLIGAPAAFSNPRAKIRVYAYFATTTGFLVAHLAHTALIYLRDA